MLFSYPPADKYCLGRPHFGFSLTENLIKYYICFTLAYHPPYSGECVQTKRVETTTKTIINTNLVHHQYEKRKKIYVYFAACDCRRLHIWKSN